MVESTRPSKPSIFNGMDYFYPQGSWRPCNSMGEPFVYHEASETAGIAILVLE